MTHLILYWDIILLLLLFSVALVLTVKALNLHAELVGKYSIKEYAHKSSKSQT